MANITLQEALALTVDILGHVEDDESIPHLINRLRRHREAMQTGDTAVIDRALISLMTAEINMVLDVDVARYIPPHAYDVLITDILEADVQAIGHALGHANLSPALPEATEWPVVGELWGEYRRPFVALPVRRREAACWALFLFDTGSPYTYITREVFDALGIRDTIPNACNVFINGIMLSVAPSHDRFQNVNLLGQNFMHAAQGLVAIDYRQGVVRLTRS